MFFFKRTIASISAALLLSNASSVWAEDRVEFLNGTQASGEILEIRKSDKEFDFKTTVGGKEFTRTFDYSQVHAVTFGGKRYELTPMVHDSAEAMGKPRLRIKSEVLKLIQEQGNKPPDWFEATQLDYPETLNLQWPQKPEGKWNNQKNVGQFIWDVVNPNESRWRSGIKLVHHCLSLHQSKPALLKRDMNKLATMYFTLLQDYPRAAFWYQKSGANLAGGGNVHLAECYWRLGNNSMALATLRSRALHVSAIKLYGDMGEIEKALRLAEAAANSQVSDEANLNAGDALRKAGRLDEAIDYYTRVLNSNTARNEDYERRFKARAKGSIEAIQLYDQADVTQARDGTYRESSTGYNGELHLAVTVAGGKIEAVQVTKHNEKQYYAALADTPKQIIEKQSIRDIDGTSGATITSQAIIHATAKALAQGTQQ